MYLEYFGFDRNPFPTTPQLDFFFTGGHRLEAIEAIDFALKENFGIIKVIGSIGSGKTMVCRQAHRNLSEDYDILFISDPSLSPCESILINVANEINPEWDLDKPKNKIFQQIIQTLLSHKKNNKPSILFIEEAQKLTSVQLEELRYLTNLETSQEKLLQIVLFGQPALDSLLLQTDQDLLSSRLTNSIFLKPLSFKEFQKYVQHRFEIAGHQQQKPLLNKMQLWIIYQLSNQSLRHANQIIEKTLFSCFVRKSLKPNFSDIATANKAIQHHGAIIRYTRSQLVSCFSIGLLIGWIGFLATQPLTNSFHSEQDTVEIQLQSNKNDQLVGIDYE